MTELLDQYRFGAGLGRTGMLSYYFGDSGSASRGLFAEVQPNAWMIDGGSGRPVAGVWQPVHAVIAGPLPAPPLPS